MSVTLLLAAEAMGEETTPSAKDHAQGEFRSILDSVLAGKIDEVEPTQWIELAIGPIVILAGLFAVWVVSSWVAAAVRASLDRVDFDKTLTMFIAKLVRWALLLLAALAALSYFGVETTSFAAVIGAAGLAIGLAFQGTLSNFAAGAMLLLFRPYKVGDVVNVAGYLGKVFEIELFTTAIDTFDNRRIIVPNSSIYGAVIENITYHGVRRVDVEVGASYEADIDQTRVALEAAIEDVQEFVAVPEPDVVLTGLGASSVDWSVRAWTRGEDFLSAKQALIRAVKLRLDAAQIGIPYPQMDVHVDGSPSAA